MDNYTQTGGTRIGSFNATWPFAHIEITKEKIIISVFTKSYEFLIKDILQLKKHHGFISTGLKIEHTNKEYDKFIVFWTFNFKKLKNNLEKLNYKILTKSMERTG